MKGPDIIIGMFKRLDGIDLVKRTGQVVINMVNQHPSPYRPTDICNQMVSEIKTTPENPSK